jgi:DNA-binding FadR family transcriptional regulator
MGKSKESSLVAVAVNRLALGIVEGSFPGDVLPTQDELATQFQVSRTVMREALSMLLSKGMLDIRPKVGTRVRPPHEWQLINEDVVGWRFRAKPDAAFLRDLIEFRTMIEPCAAAQAARRATDEQIAAIRVAFDVLKTYSRVETGRALADLALHTLIVQASGNQLLQQMVPLLRAAIDALHLAVSDKTGTDGALALHERLVMAIEQRDPNSAQAEMNAIIAASMAHLEPRPPTFPASGEAQT